MVRSVPDIYGTLLVPVLKPKHLSTKEAAVSRVLRWPVLGGDTLTDIKGGIR